MSGASKSAVALCFVSAFLLTLLVTAPASLLDRYLQSASRGRLVLANASGTIWNGSATPALRGQEGYPLALPPLYWAISAWPLLGGSIEARLQWGASQPESGMRILVSPGRAELHRVQLTLPARIIEEVAPLLKPAQLRGQLRIQSEQVSFSGRGIEGAAKVEWQQAGSALSSVDPLGNYHLALNGAGDRIEIGLATTSGKLLLEGQGSWAAARGLEFRGSAQSSPGNHEALAELLRNLGPEASAGVHGFHITPRR